MEHRVPFMFSEGFKKGRLTLQKTIELLATNAANYFGFARKKGSLTQGTDADYSYGQWLKPSVGSRR